jgi:hypothetical protein
MINLFRGVLRRTARPILLTVAVLYFLIDLIFLSVARPLRRRIELDEKIARMGGQSQPLRRVAVTACAVAGSGADQTTRFLLFSHRHHLAATLLIVGGEVVKLTLFEQLFDMTKPKLMSFHWFAWCYGAWRAAIEYLRSLPAWHRMYDWYHTILTWVQHRWYLQ